jgi:hypothetical protein
VNFPKLQMVVGHNSFLYHILKSDVHQAPRVVRAARDEKEGARMVKPLVKLALVVAGIWVCFQGYRQWQQGLPPAQMAEFAMWREDWPSALEHLSAQRAADPHNHLIVARMAECYDRMGDTRTALWMYRGISRYLDDRDDANRKRYHRERFRELQSQAQAAR